MTETPVIDLKIELFERDGQPILSDIEWVVQRDETWVIIGANGSGKSTLLSIVAGYEWPSRGEVSLFGHTYGQCYMPDIKRRIGLVNQTLYQWLPASQPALHVAASGRYATIGSWHVFDHDDLKAARTALEAIGAAHLEQRAYGVLSQGEKQRVLIARALVSEPELLILDEACAGLDPGARANFLLDIDRLAARPKPTLITVVHHVEDIPAESTHVLILKNGNVLRQGKLAEALTSDTLSEAFDVPCRIFGRPGSYTLAVAAG